MAENTWPAKEALVLADLERLEKGQERIIHQLDDLRVQVATLKIQASIWGSLSGAIGAALAGMFYALIRR